jgi:hypothetical protein
MMYNLKHRRWIGIIAVFFILATTSFIALPVKQAEACCSCKDTIDPVSDEEWFDEPKGTVDRITRHVESEFTAHRLWFVHILWEDNILPAMMLMAEQLSAVAMQQTQIIGSFLDASHQMETQQTLRTLNARAHKDYHPSVGMCEFGTAVKSLAASERKGELHTFTLSQRIQDRALKHSYTSSASGESLDKASRLAQFKNDFCDPADNNNGMQYICDTGNPEPERMNKDIDYARTFEWPWTLDIDFSDDQVTNHEEEILALASNLYGHKVFKNIPSDALKEMNDTEDDITFIQMQYQNARAVLAKRSVAENSFNAITAMKAEGTGGSREYLIEVLKELGIDGDEAEKLLANDGNLDPSYYAQMEILTKKALQNPDFYTNLYDKPANVERKGVAIQAIGLMQKFDLFKSYLRNEAALSVLLELAVQDLQDDVENDINITE